MKVEDIIQRVQSLYSKGVQSDDTRLSNRHIYNKMITVRAKLISQEAKKKQKISLWNYQPIPCIELIKVSTHDCPCIPSIGCQILRSKYEIPEPLSGLSGNLIQSVSTIMLDDSRMKIDEISINALNSQKGNKYTSNKINYFIYNNYIYLNAPSTSKLKFISLLGLFEDPIEAAKFRGYCDCEDCIDCIDYMEEEFPLDNDLIDTLVELTIRELVVLFSQSIEDVTNNSLDSAKQQSK